MKRDEILFLKDILNSISNIETFSKNLSKEKLTSNRLKQSAIIREFEIIGEAVKNISNKTRDKYTSVEWRKIAGTRDIFIHRYFMVDLDRVWELIITYLSPLKKQIQKIKDDLESNE